MKMTTNMNFIAVKIKEIKMAQEKNVTRNLILLLIGMIVIYLLQKNGNFFPILFVVISIFLIWKNKSGFSKKDFIIGIALAALSLNPIYVICIIFGYMGAKQLYDKSNVKISLLPKTKQEIIVYGVLPAIFLTLLNTVWMIQTNPIDFSFRVNAIVGGLIASIPEEVLFRYLVFAVCVYMGKGKVFSNFQNILCYIILILPHVLMHFPAGIEMNVIDLGLMSVFGIVLTFIQRKSSLTLAIGVHFIIDFIRLTIFGV